MFPCKIAYPSASWTTLEFTIIYNVFLWILSRNQRLCSNFNAITYSEFDKLKNTIPIK